MNRKPPVNLDLRTIAFPPMAIASILHRLSGIALFLLLPVMLCLLQCSLKNADSFAAVQLRLANVSIKLVVWAFLAALVYHLIAGIRHMVMDLGYGEEVATGRRSAIFVIALAVILTILLGIWIW